MRRLTFLATLVTTVWLGLGASLAQTAAAPPPLQYDEHDPLEDMNRKIFWFNDQVDNYVLVPLAKGWDTIAPGRVQRCLSNFFQNLRFPIVAANNLLQAKPGAAASDVGRFLVNTTVGLAGFFDPASKWGLEQHNEDFGQTLGYWGVPPGPYIVLPFFGPSGPRDTAGFVVDAFSIVYAYFIDYEYTFGAAAVDVVNMRALTLKEVEQIKEASLDYYTAVRDGYRQRREALVNDSAVPSQEQQDDLYQIEEDSGE